MSMQKSLDSYQDAFPHQCAAFYELATRFDSLRQQHPQWHATFWVLALECTDLSDALYRTACDFTAVASRNTTDKETRRAFVTQAVEIGEQLLDQIDAKLPRKRTSWLRRSSMNKDSVFNEQEWLEILPPLWALNAALRLATPGRSGRSSSADSPHLVMDDATLLLESCRTLAITRTISVASRGSNVGNSSTGHSKFRQDKSLASTFEKLKEFRQVLTVGQGPHLSTATPNRDFSTELSRAAARGHQAAVQSLLEQHVESLGPRRLGCTPLNEAASHGHQTIVHLLLLQNNAATDALAKTMINRPCHLGGTPLYWAASRGDAATMQLLLEYEAEASQPRVGGKTPLQIAAARGHVSATRLLLKLGVPVNTMCHAGSTPLHAAVTFGDVELVRDLLAAGADPIQRDLQGATPLHVAATKPREDMIRVLVEHNPSTVNQEEGSFAKLTPVDIAVRAGHEEIVQFLVAHGADLTRKSFKCLSDATSRGHFAMVQYLLTQVPREAITTFQGDSSPLFQAVSSRDHNLAQMFLSLTSNADVMARRPTQGDKILHVAARQGDLDMIDAILGDSEYDVDVIDKHGQTALLQAAVSNKEGAVRCLLEHHARIPSPGRSPAGDARNVAPGLRLIGRVARSLEADGKKINGPTDWDARIREFAKMKENNWHAQQLIDKRLATPDGKIDVGEDPGYSAVVMMPDSRSESRHSHHFFSHHHASLNVGASMNGAGSMNMFGAGGAGA